VLRVRNLDAGYGRRDVLRRVTLHVGQGEVVAIVGANGAGKTTLLKTITGLVRARAGEITLRGEDVTRLRTEQVVGRGCSLVPEGRQVFAPMSVRENLLLGGHVQYRRGKARQVAEDVDRVYRLFPVLQKREKQLAGTLSGGEQQMLAMGRALMARPDLLMLDEPSMGLAPLVVREIFDIVSKVAEAGCTVLLVEQNARGALGISDRGYVLETGRIVLSGTAEELLANQDVQRAYLGRDAEARDAGPEGPETEGRP
jgi:branched-chain amino acid transport system ATP-binding protein